MPLQHFSPRELLLSKMEAWQVLVYFFGGNAGVSPSTTTDADRAFAQALIVEAINRSARAGLIRQMWEALARPLPPLQERLARLVEPGTPSLRPWLQPRGAHAERPTRIYGYVREELTKRFGEVWRQRVRSGQPLLY